MPLISIIVPVYKNEKYINRCVKSIINQTLTDFELILIDDGSPDKSGELCDQWSFQDKRIRVIHQENKGAGAARNAGLAVAQGQYIGFVDSDDWIHPQMYEILYNALSTHNCQAAMCKLTNQKKYISTFPQINKYSVSKKNQTDMLKRFFRVHGEDSSIQQIGTRLILRDILKKFRFIEGTISEDVAETYFYVMNTVSTAVIDLPLYYYFINQFGVTRSPVTMKDMEYINAYKRILQDIAQNKSEFEQAAYMNYLRANFTILSKMKLFGYDKKNPDLSIQHKKLQQIVRNNFYRLLMWPMPFSRKILLLYVCI